MAFFPLEQDNFPFFPSWKLPMSSDLGPIRRGRRKLQIRDRLPYKVWKVQDTHLQAGSGRP